MPRQTRQYEYRLHPKATESLPMPDICAILRAADDLIAVGGRTLLTKILRGSRAKEVLSHGLEQNPAYGYYRELPEEEVLARIDWTIRHGYLRIIYQGKLPVLVFAPAGWSIERDAIADEIVRGFDALLADGQQRPYAMGYLKDRNREMILLVLDQVLASGDSKYIPVLEDWSLVDCRKIRERIAEVIGGLAPCS